MLYEVITLFQGNGFVIIQEKEISGKDSSLLLQAGAKQVYFVMAGQENLQDAFDVLQPILPRHAIVCESGGLHQVVNPGFFFFINRNGAELIKEEHLSHSVITSYSIHYTKLYERFRLKLSSRAIK